MKGAVAIGYRLMNEIFYGTTIQMTKDKRTVSPINDYNSIMETNSEFIYRAVDTVEALTIRKYLFNQIMR